MIEPILLVVAVLAVNAGFLYLKYFHRHMHHQVDVLAGKFGLTVDGDSARGHWRGHPMEASLREIGDKGGQILLRVGGADPRLKMTREPFRLFDRPHPPPGPYIPPSLGSGYREAEDIVTGDEEFDGRVRVKGPAGHSVGVLDRETRGLVLATVALGAVAADGWIIVDLMRRPRADDDIAGWLKLMAELAETLAKRGRARPIDNLLNNFNGELDPEVRRVNLACLGAYYPDAPETLEASRAALSDPGSDWIRLQGAVNLRREGWPALQTIVEDPGRLDGVRAAALRALGLSLPPDEAEALLLERLNSEEPGLALSAVDTLGDVGRTAVVAARLDRWAEGRREKAEGRLAKEAAERVRSRLEGTEPGRLSLEETVEEGRLSRPDEDRAGDP